MIFHLFSILTLQNIGIWNRSIPLSFQAFENNNYGSKFHISYKCNNKTMAGVDYYYSDPSPCVDLSKIKKKTLYTIYPNIENNTRCTMMLLTNLAHPEWININCQENLLSHVMCVEDISYLFENLSEYYKEIKLYPFCSSKEIMILGHCFSFQ